MRELDRKKIIDIHAHILPGVDDGARDLKESIALAVSAASQGIRAVIATPHFSRRGDPDEYRQLLKSVQTEIWKSCPDFQLYLGQELYYHEDLGDRLLSGQALTLADSSYILVEFDPAAPFSRMSRGIRNLCGLGYIPVLAHAERYGCLRESGMLERLREMGALFQVNYESLTGRWYDRDVFWCRKQIREHRIHFLSTDMHQMDHRPPEIKRALDWLDKNVDAEYKKSLTEGKARRILEDGAVR